MKHTEMSETKIQLAEYTVTELDRCRICVEMQVPWSSRTITSCMDLYHDTVEDLRHMKRPKLTGDAEKDLFILRGWEPERRRAERVAEIIAQKITHHLISTMEK